MENFFIPLLPQSLVAGRFGSQLMKMIKTGLLLNWSINETKWRFASLPVSMFDATSGLHPVVLEYGSRLLEFG
jgi:hypothetical protein